MKARLFTVSALLMMITALLLSGVVSASVPIQATPQAERDQFADAGDFSLPRVTPSESAPVTAALNNVSVTTAGSWTLTGSLATPRYDHGIALLKNGKVLVTAGRRSDSWVLASSELYDPACGSWSVTDSLNTARFWFQNVVVLNNGKVLIAGGYTGRDDLASAELYDPATGTWSYTGRLKTPRRNASLTLLNDGRVLIAGGAHGRPTGDRFLASAEIYDPTTGTWSYTGSLNVAREWHMAVRLLDGRVLIAGGEGPWWVTGNTAEIYDPTTGTWSTTGSMSIGRVEGSMTLLPNGKVLVTGGWNRSVFYASAELYDPVTGTWTPINSMNVARARHAATLLPDGRLLVAGGTNASGAQASSEIYDPVTGAWSFDASFQVPRSAHMAVTLLNGKILAVGGWKGHPSTGALASSELYYEDRPMLMPFLSSPCGGNCRVTAYFDHCYPTYRDAPNSCSPDSLKKMCPYWVADSKLDAWYLDSGWHFRCDQSDTTKCWNYSGHDGYDYAGFNVVLAAGAGQVAYIGCASSGQTYPCPSSYGLVVDIDHENGYLTRYGHLKQASVAVGSSVSVRQQIGLVGSTGFATGPHLHFMVYRDVNGNGQVDSVDIPVDPYGPNPVRGDLWRAHAVGTSSYWLWTSSPPTTSSLMPAVGGGLTAPDGDVVVAVPAGAVISNTTLYYTVVPEPPYTPVGTSATAALRFTGVSAVSAGRTFSLGATDEAGNPLTTLLASAVMTITFADSDLTYVNSDTLSVYLWNESSSIWTPLPSTLVLASKTVSTTITMLGIYSLRGQPSNPPPMVLAVDPVKGDTIVDTQITVSGTSFLETPFVRIGEWYLPDVRFISTSTLTATIPAGLDAGIYDVTVENPDGQPATLLNAFTLIGKMYLPLILRSY